MSQKQVKIVSQAKYDPKKVVAIPQPPYRLEGAGELVRSMTSGGSTINNSGKGSPAPPSTGCGRYIRTNSTDTFKNNKINS
jgi:hypothetical protein